MDHLEEMFASPPGWDTSWKYKPDSLSVYYEGFDKSKLVTVDPKCTLKQILTSGKYLVRNWKLSFLIFVKGSLSEKNFLKNYCGVET